MQCKPAKDWCLYMTTPIRGGRQLPVSVNRELSNAACGYDLKI